MVRTLGSLFLLASLYAAPARAETQWIIKDRSIHSDRPQRLDIVGFISGAYTATQIGGGVHYSIPIVPDGFIKPINDAFYLEFTGLIAWWHESYCDHSAFRLSPLGGVRWDFFLTPDWTVFGKAKAGWHIGFNESYSCFGINQSRPANISALAVDFGAGALWNFSDGMALRMETGVLSLFMIGLSMEM